MPRVQLTGAQTARVLRSDGSRTTVYRNQIIDLTTAEWDALGDMQSVFTNVDGGGGVAGPTPVTVIAASGAAQTLDCDGAAAAYVMTLTGNCVVTVEGAVADAECVVTLKLIQDATGGRIPTFPGVDWPLGEQPRLSVLPGKVDWLQFVSLDGGPFTGFLMGVAAS